MLFDIEVSKSKTIAEKFGADPFNSMMQIACEADLILLCTPIKETPKVIRSIIPYMKDGSVLCEIASLKLKVMEALKIASTQSVQPISIHPMFGPDIEQITGQTILLVPILDPVKEEVITRELFPNNEIIIVDAESHDSYMAAILSLSYFMNLVFAKSIQTMDFKLLRRLAGSTFTVQFALAQSVLDESSELVESLINENPYAKDIINRFIDESKHIRRLLKRESKDFKAFCDEMQKNIVSIGNDGRKLRTEFFKTLKKPRYGT